MPNFNPNSDDAPKLRRFNVSLFGKGEIRDFQGNLIAFPKLTLVLIAYLILDCLGGKSTRQIVSDLLWSNSDGTTKSGNLRQLILRIRSIMQANEIDLFIFDNDCIQLNFNCARVDLLDFQTAAVSTDDSVIERLFVSFSGDLLTSFEGKNEAITDWVNARRAALRSLFMDKAVPWLDLPQSINNIELLEYAAKRMVALDPYEESGYRALISLAALRGKNTQISKTYNALKQLLFKDLKCEPSEKTQALFKSLMKGIIYSPQISPSVIAHQLSPSTLSTASANPKTFSSGNWVPSHHFSHSTPVLINIQNQNRLPHLAIVANIGSLINKNDQEYFDYILDDIVFNLIQMTSFRISRPKFLTDYSRENKELGWDNILSFRVIWISSQQIIQMQLSSAQTGEVLCAKRFIGFEKFAQDAESIIQTITQTIIGTRRINESLTTEKKHENVKLFEAQSHLKSIDLPSIRRARNQFKLLVNSSTQNADALSGLCRSLVLEWLLRMNLDNSLLLEAEHLAQKVIQVSPQSHAGYLELGIVQMYLKKFDNIVELISRASDMQSENDEIKIDLADALVAIGTPKVAVSVLSNSRTNSQTLPEIKYWTAAGAFYGIGDYKSALIEIAKMKNPAPVLRISAAANSMLGNKIEAKANVRDFLKFNPNFSVEAWISRVPLSDRIDIQHFSDGLREAGFM